MDAEVRLYPAQLGRDHNVSLQEDHWRLDAVSHHGLTEGRGDSCLCDLEQSDAARNAGWLLHRVGQRLQWRGGNSMRDATSPSLPRELRRERCFRRERHIAGAKPLRRRSAVLCHPAECGVKTDLGGRVRRKELVR